MKPSLAGFHCSQNADEPFGDPIGICYCSGLFFLPHFFPIEVVNRRTAKIFGWIFGYLAAIWLLGFSVGLTLCAFLQLKLDGRENWPITLVLTSFAGALTYGFFERLLHIPFPRGLLAGWLAG